jgi:hypothetical protein
MFTVITFKQCLLEEKSRWVVRLFTIFYEFLIPVAASWRTGEVMIQQILHLQQTSPEKETEGNINIGNWADIHKTFTILSSLLGRFVSFFFLPFSFR